MKRLLIALAAAVAMLTASARVTDTQSFEESFSDFEPSVAAEDESALVDYDNDGRPDFAAPYDFTGFGDKYLSLDTGDATLWRTNTAAGNVYFDMALQFNPSASEPQLETDDPTKILLYMNTESNLVIYAGTSSSDRTPTSYVTTTKVAPGTWARVTVSSSLENDGYVFTVRVNGTPLATAEEVASFPSLTDATEISQIGFAGSGALDDFVARTTDPFFDNNNAVVSVGGLTGERYASLADALADDPTATPQLEANTSLATPLAYGESISVKLNNHTLSGITTGSLVPVASTSGDVTTYTARYFPRTATAGQDGTTANPYEIADADDLVALQDAVLADAATFASKSYVQTANINMTGVAGFYGIGWFKSSDSYASLPPGLASASTNLLFTGVYDGGGYTISNVTLVRHNYAGVFNNVSGTVKNLTVQNLGFATTDAGEWGCAIVGNAQDSALLENLTSAGTVWGDYANHNVAGTVVRVQNTVTIRGCVNNAPITAGSRRLGGIVAFTGNTAPTGTITIEGCTNNAALTVVTDSTLASSSAGDRGIGGIISRPESIANGLLIRNCANFGVLTNNGYPAKVGGIAGELNSQNYVDGGGNTFLASLGPVGNYNSKTVTGLAYALPSTIAEADYLTTVKQADLAAGSTYTLLANVAASETPVYTFDAAGTIAFNTNGYNFAGTVAADTTTLVLAEPVTEGTVTTYAAAAGVASVDNFAYATFAEAVAAITDDPEKDDFVTLLADVEYAVSAGATLKVKTSGHTFTPTKASDDVLISDSTDENDVMTVIATKGVANCNGTWYASFDSAYNAALAAEGNATMVVRITEDFTPAISATYNHFYSLTFEDVRDDNSEGLTINLKNSAGTAFMKSSRYFFPNNAKLVLAADWEPWQTGLATGGTLEIPEGVTVSNLGSWEALNGLSAVVGAGTVAPSAAVCYWFVRNEGAVLPTSMRADTWTGTLVLTGTFDQVWSLGNYGNTNSTIRFNGVTTYLSTGEHPVNVDIVGEGLTINGNYQSGTWTFSGDLTGTGPLNVAIENSSGSTLKAVKFTGDASEFAGSIDFGENANAYVQFGSEGVASNELAAKRIITGDDAEVTVASGETWKADAFMLHGNVTLDGSLRNIDDTDAGVVWNNHSSAVFTVNAAGLFKFGNYTTWTGTYVVNHSLASAATAFIIPTSANATTVINGDENEEFVGFPSTGSGPPTVEGKIVLNADWTTGDGWSSESYATTFASLSGSGDLTVNDKNNYYYQLWYKITELDGYTGTLGGRNGMFVIGKVNVAEMPADGARVVKTACGTYGEIAGDLKLFVDGVDTGKTLTYVADGAQGAGLYYVIPKNYVAQIGETKYETLSAAVSAAQAGDTITLLGNLELDARVEPNKTMTFDLGGFTLSRTGTGGNGSVIDVKGGDVTITNGVIDCTQDDTAIVADGVYALTVRSGATLTLDDLTVTVDSQAGACVYPFAGATVTILGGTYGNNTADAYQYHADWTGMAVNQANVSQQLITISGGRFYKVDPSLGDDSGLVDTFLAEGYESKKDGDYWVVSEKTSEPVTPGEDDGKTYNSAKDAEDAAAEVEVGATAAVETAVGSAGLDAYLAKFEGKVVDNGDGTFKVVVGLTAEAETALADDATTNVMATVAASLPDIISDAAAEQTEVTVSNVVPGFYYSISYGTALGAMNTEGTRVLAPASGTITLQTPAKAANATAGFYRVNVNVTDK